jgi:glyoxylase-like metal-dependent hydrolase (beta-lactamase superfamily II)
MQFEVFPIGPLDTNCFVIHTGSAAVAVDPGGPPEPVLDFLAARGLKLTHIFLTHLHFDHTYGVAGLAAGTGATVLASDKDGYMLENELGRGGVWGLPLVDEYTFTPLHPGEIALLDTTCAVLATPGHTPGGLSFYFPELKAVFAGDALFYRSIGRSDFPGGSQSALVKSIREVLFALPEETTVYTGHGDATGIGDERRNNPFVSDFSVK